MRGRSSTATDSDCDPMPTKRKIEELGYAVADDVLYAIDLLQRRYGASDHRDSKHTKGRPTWIFELPAYGAEVGVPMNKRDLTLYMRNRTLDGRKLTDLLPSSKVTRLYPRDGKSAGSINNSSFLGPKSGNECVMLELERSDLEPLFELFFAIPAPALAPTVPPPPSRMPAGAKPPMDAETFEALLERRSEIGQAGELFVVQDEIERLKRLGCGDPEHWVERVALADIGRGYDVASTWPGQERYIEVKSTSSASNGLFITDNERKVLEGLGLGAWLYRVVVKEGGIGDVMARVRDPMGVLAGDDFVPVVFRVDADAIRRAAIAASTRDE